MLIHDITTDTEDPPRFVALLAIRLKCANGAAYGGARVAAAQRAKYPDIEPLRSDQTASAVFEAALKAANLMQWKIADAQATEGRIEATATTRFLRFKDDVVIRVQGDGARSRVDVRSASRIGRSDFGANAARIRRYLAILKSCL